MAYLRWRRKPLFIQRNSLKMEQGERNKGHWFRIITIEGSFGKLTERMEITGIVNEGDSKQS